MPGRIPKYSNRKLSGNKILTTVLISQVGEAGRVVGIDHIKELVELSIANTSRNHSQLMSSSTLQYVVGDGRKGYSQGAPYDCIHVGAAAPTLPQPVCEALHWINAKKVTFFLHRLYLNFRTNISHLHEFAFYSDKVFHRSDMK